MQVSFQFVCNNLQLADILFYIQFLQTSTYLPVISNFLHSVFFSILLFYSTITLLIFS
ncbi:hypothetical protein L873DRAFT_925899 [Choiromyces venosus 120613-1]|uniref:Uncharacterized protein n=1 Tax=Choiromyces venosus 120613-1 TaxID=1336337 RepID=A0A3N4JTE6_9PEZI|nr:hypothetical protein L873DRAFT_925899 [Choiromyces venosus 120613-1]